jgi:hypothetical protein
MELLGEYGQNCIAKLEEIIYGFQKIKDSLKGVKCFPFKGKISEF